MKSILLTCCIIFSTILFAQIPQAFKYQAVARDANGELLVNQQISVRITIIDSTAGGASVYSEVHKAGTNQFGLFSLSIGEGIIPTGVFANIPWASGNKWIKIELDPTGDTNYSDMGTHPLLSVPYALYAGSSANSAEDSTNELQTLSISGHNLSISNGNTIVLPYDSIDDADSDSTNELQAISISNDTVFLSNGGFVKLPPDTPTFNPAFPDGTDNLIAVNRNVSAAVPYTVPSGRNFHGYIEAPNHLQYPIIINGEPMSGYNLWMNISLKGGDVISTTSGSPSDLVISGYTSPQRKQIVYAEINSGLPYHVPSGRQFYLTWLTVVPWSGLLANAPLIAVNGARIPYFALVGYSRTTYFIIDGGSSIITNATNGTKVFINGFLK